MSSGICWFGKGFVRFMLELDKFQMDLRAEILELQNWIDTIEVDDGVGKADTENS